MLKITLQINNEAPLLRLAAINRGSPEGKETLGDLRKYEIVLLGENGNKTLGSIEHFRESGAAVLAMRALEFYELSKDKL